MFINHWHTAPEGTFDKDDPQKGTLVRVYEIMQKTGIHSAIAFAPFLHCMPNDTWYNISLKTEKECNEWLWCSLKNYPEIIGFVTVSPGNPDSSGILIEYINKGFKGVKIHPPVFQIKIGDVSHEEFYSTAEDLNVPVLFHTGSHGWQPDKYRPALIGQLASRHPMLKIIIEHTGGKDYFNEALDVLKNNPNCYAGITSTILKTIEDGRPNSSYLGEERISLLINEIGTERIIYGVDYPFNDEESTAREIEFIRQLPISETDKENPSLCSGSFHKNNHFISIISPQLGQCK